MEAIKDWGHVERREESQEMMIQLAQARRSTPVPSFCRSQNLSIGGCLFPLGEPQGQNGSPEHNGKYKNKANTEILAAPE
jgi:hypothetical protein